MTSVKEQLIINSPDFVYTVDVVPCPHPRAYTFVMALNRLHCNNCLSFWDCDTYNAPIQLCEPRPSTYLIFKEVFDVSEILQKKREVHQYFILKSFFFSFHKGFAVSLQVILSNPKAVFKRRGSQPGMQESDFLKQITTVEELEPKANNCTKVLVWHTRTEKVNLANEPKYRLDTVKIEV
uniref:Galactosylgalactosylxylosylprotein 3-beta-glucuronosyltransferase n=1 Tax=Canis lupus dingo TaxID=286419 RepID=A0A8C0K5R8_CANLU